MHRSDGRVVSNFIVQALNGEAITLYGDGNQSRSFCYVDDLIEGFLRLMASPEDVALTIHPHPTLGEGVMEAFKHALGEAVHVMNRKGARRSHRPNAPALAAA